ncbi:MAG TPA: DinB family protein [Chryseosolibacter sp.]
MTDELEQLKFPIGPFEPPAAVDAQQLADLIATIETAPAKYRALTENLSSADLKKTYRADAWNIQQLVSHVADMQMLHLFRMKKALTEPDYKELTLVNIRGWAGTHDGIASPVADSLAMLDVMTRRFVFLVRSLNPAQQEITYYHPVRKINLNQRQAIAMSAWHVKHHLEHIRIALRTTESKHRFLV